MNNLDVVAALKYCVDDSHAFCNGCPACDICDADSDRIISIAAHRMENLMKGIERTQKKNAQLRNQLQAMERERDHALKLLGRIDLDCRYCAHNIQDESECERNNFQCSKCKADCICKECTEGSNWKWKGVEDEWED